jgi:hypothetical protein
MKYVHVVTARVSAPHEKLIFCSFIIIIIIIIII